MTQFDDMDGELPECGDGILGLCVTHVTYINWYPLIYAIDNLHVITY